MSVFSLNQTSEGLCTSWLEASHPQFCDCVRALLSSSVASNVEDAWSAYSVSCCTRCFWETLFNGKNTVSCSWLINAECCISLFTDTNESQLWHIQISSFVTVCFLSFPLLDVLLIEQSLTVYGLTLIHHNSQSLYKNPLGIPISVQIPLSIQGNNINHIISYQDDKVGLALSVSCRKSCTSFFIGFGLMHSHSCWCLWVANCCLISK